MYPVTLIRISKNKKISIELKNNLIYEGILRDCDLLMNIHLEDCKIINNENDTVEVFKECILKGIYIKTIKLHSNVFNIQKKLEKQKENK